MWKRAVQGCSFSVELLISLVLYSASLSM